VTKIRSLALAGAAYAAMLCPVSAANLNIPAGDLDAALDTYSVQTGVHLLYSQDAVEGIRSQGVKGNIADDAALSRILHGTGLTTRRDTSGAIAIYRGGDSSSLETGDFRLAQATPARAAVETVTVTSSKLGGADVQSIPIAITALSQEQLTATQTAGALEKIISMRDEVIKDIHFYINAIKEEPEHLPWRESLKAREEYLTEVDDLLPEHYRTRPLERIKIKFDVREALSTPAGQKSSKEGIEQASGQLVTQSGHSGHHPDPTIS
jgi:hypothetical protein